MAELNYAAPMTSKAVFGTSGSPSRDGPAAARRAAVAVPVRLVRLWSELQDRTAPVSDVRRRILGMPRTRATEELHVVLAHGTHVDWAVAERFDETGKGNVLVVERAARLARYVSSCRSPSAAKKA
jgi:hypothetical protein